MSRDTANELQKSLGDRFRAAREAKSLTQAQLHQALGGAISQTSLSLFERGAAHVLSRENILKLARTLELDIEPDTLDQVTGRRGPATWVMKYCLSALCPSNYPYLAPDGTVALLPRMVRARAGGATYCRHCGKPLNAMCPNESCSAPVSGGAFCEVCGERLAPIDSLGDVDAAAWVERRREEVERIRAWAEPAKARPGP